MTLSEKLIPESEQWLDEPQVASRLDRAIAAMNQPPKEADLDGLEDQLRKLV